MIGKVIVGLYVVVIAYVYVHDCIHNVRMHRLVVRSEQIRKEQQANQRLMEDARREKEVRIGDSIDAEFRSFMEKEAPSAKKCLDWLCAEAESQKMKEEGLWQTLEKFGHDPNCDEEFKELCKHRQGMLNEIENVSNQLITAYIASVKYSVAPSRMGMSELRENALREGIDSAVAACSRYEKLKGAK
mgnify:CR=1 FL=1